MGPKLSKVTIFFSSDVLRLSTEAYMLSGYKDASPKQSSRYPRVNKSVSIWAPLKIIIFDGNFRWGPNVTLFFASDVLRLATEASLWFRCARCLTRTLGFQTVSIRSPSNILILSAPMEIYTFWWGPNFMLSPSSLVDMFSDTQRQLLLVRVELFRKMPHQNIRLHNFFLPQVGTE